MFVHEDLGVVIHGSQTGSEGLQKLIAVEIPFLVTLETSTDLKGNYTEFFISINFESNNFAKFSPSGWPRQLMRTPYCTILLAGS